MCGCCFYTTKDFITYVWNRFYTFPAVLKRTLSFNDRLVHHTGGHVVIITEITIEESFVVAHVLICLKSRTKHEHLAMLGRVHGACVYVQVRINLCKIHFVPTGFQDETDGRACNALSYARHHPADDEYVFVSCERHIRFSGIFSQQRNLRHPPAQSLSL